MLILNADPNRGGRVNNAADSGCHDARYATQANDCTRVGSSCDYFMVPSFPNSWCRENQYATKLDNILAIFSELKRCPGYNSHPIMNHTNNRFDPVSCSAKSDAFSDLASSSSAGRPKLLEIDSISAFPDSSVHDQMSPLTYCELSPDTPYELPDRQSFAAPFAQYYSELPAQNYSEIPAQDLSELSALTPSETRYEPSAQLPPDFLAQYSLDASAQTQNPLEFATQLSHEMISPELPNSTHQRYPAARLSTQSNVESSSKSSKCDNCGWESKSKPRDLRANINRHKDTVCARRNRFSCPEPDCEKKFPRSDYLRAHVKEWHEIAAAQRTRRRKTKVVEGQVFEIASTAGLSNIISSGQSLDFSSPPRETL